MSGLQDLEEIAGLLPISSSKMPIYHPLTLLSAGSNARGQLATGNTEDSHRFTPCHFEGMGPGSLPEHVVAIKQIACGANHTLTLLLDEAGRTELWGCGDGSRGQLGPGCARDSEANGAVFRPLDLQLREIDLSSPPEEYTVRHIAAGWETSYVVLSCPSRSDVLLSFGADDFGNLGAVSLSTKPTSTPTATEQKHRIHVVDLHRALNTSPHTSTTTVLALAAGPHHVLAHVRLREPAGSSLTYFVGWGASRHGQLGPILDRAGRPLPTCPAPVPILCAAPSDANVSAALALGTQHTVYMRASGGLVGLGSNRKGQLDGLASLADVAQVACTWNGTYALLRDGRVLATGSNTHAQLGRGGGGSDGGLEAVVFPFEFGAGTRTVAKLVCGSEHVLCLVDVSVSGSEGGGEERKEREVWGWGWNEHGNLGIGGTADSNVPIKIWPPRTERPDGDDVGCWGDVLDVWAGCGTSWILVQKRS